LFSKNVIFKKYVYTYSERFFLLTQKHWSQSCLAQGCSI